MKQTLRVLLVLNCFILCLGLNACMDYITGFGCDPEGALDPAPVKQWLILSPPLIKEDKDKGTFLWSKSAVDPQLSAVNCQKQFITTTDPETGRETKIEISSYRVAQKKIAQIVLDHTSAADQRRILNLFFNDQPAQNNGNPGYRQKAFDYPGEDNFEHPYFYSHSKWMVSIDLETQEGFFIQHSFPKSPPADFQGNNILNQDSWVNSQQIMCLTLGRDEIVDFIDRALDTYPYFVGSNFDFYTILADDNIDKSIVELLWRIDHIQKVEVLTKRDEQTHQKAKNCLLHVRQNKNWDKDGVCASAKVYEGFTQIVHFPLPSLDENYLQTQNSLLEERGSVYPIAWSISASLMKAPFLGLWDESQRKQQSNWIPSNPEYPILLPKSLTVSVGQTKIVFDSNNSHLKMGVHPDGVVCIGDSNLEGGQVGRSGLTICFRDQALAKAFFFGADLVCTTQPTSKLSVRKYEIVDKQDYIRVSKPGLEQMLNTYVQQPVENNNNQMQIDTIDGYLPMETSSESYDSDAPLFWSSEERSSNTRSTHYDSDADLFSSNPL